MIATQYRPFTVAGDLMSYGTPIETYSLAGVYAGRVLQGENINLEAAKAVGVTVPLSLLGLADEVIE